MHALPCAALTMAAVQGLIAGLALASCASPKTPNVTAPMEVAAPVPPTSLGTEPRMQTFERIAEPVPKDCCRGRNDCKGLSGCAIEHDACKGKNACKGTGTSCDEYDPNVPSARESGRRKR